MEQNMYIEFDDNMKIATIQEVFHDVFPYLKIEFFERDITIHGSIATRKYISNGNRTLGDFRPVVHDPYNICIKPEMTVAELEQNFSRQYKLHTQIFRKSGNVWLETTVTDAWTLLEQNRQGEAISTQIKLAKARS